MPVDRGVDDDVVGVAGLLLAAGPGHRYGMPKALVRHGDALLVEHAVRTLRDGGCAPIVVVLGAAAEDVRRRADLSDATLVDNPDWRTGMGSSLRAGLAVLTALDSEHVATVVLLVDTPGVTPAAVARLTEDAGRDRLAVATYRGERGHPVLLGRGHWPGAAASAAGDVGARTYLAGQQAVEVPCDDIADGTDLDQPPKIEPGPDPTTGP